LKELTSTFTRTQECSLMLVLWNCYSQHATSKSGFLRELPREEKGKKNLGRWQWGEKEWNERRTCKLQGTKEQKWQEKEKWKKVSLSFNRHLWLLIPQVFIPPLYPPHQKGFSNNFTKYQEIMIIIIITHKQEQYYTISELFFNIAQD
jgi:hypothetical protein